jgi:putative ABC transport system permease protein
MMTLGRLVHRVATRAYPASFRRRFATDLDRVFADRLSQAAATSSVRAAFLLLFLLADTVASGLAERARPKPRRSLAMVLESLSADLRFALRYFRRAPMFTLLTTVSLALGIGASTAIFSVVNAVLLRPLPYAAPDRLVAIWSDNTRQNQPANPVSPANFEAFATAPSLARVEGMFSFLTSSNVQSDGQPDYVQVATLTPGMFDLLGRRPLVGTVFQRGEKVPRVVLSYGYWQRRFGGDSNVIGRTITFPGTPPVAIAGVMPADFTFPYRSMLGPSGFSQALEPDLWMPLLPTPATGYLDTAGQPTRTFHYLAVVGRLGPGANIERARADLEAIATRRAADFPDSNRGWNVTVRPLHDQTVGAIRPALLILLGGVAIVLLITCVNVANVMLARAGARQRDLSVRSALGATGSRLTQYSLVESVMLGVLGGGLGVALAVAAVRALLAFPPANLPRISEVSIDLRVALFAVLVSLATGVAVGLAPALSASRTAAADALRESRRTTVSAARRRLRSGLVVAEVALAMTLAVGAGLLIRSFVAVLGVDPGFRSDGLLTMQLNVPPQSTQGQGARLAFYDSLEAQLRAIPGVTEVGGTTRLPLGSTSVSTTVNVEGRSTPPSQMPDVELRRAVFNYFGAMDIPLLRGRTFNATDSTGTPIVGIVNTALVAKVFPGEDPIGRRVRLGPDPAAAPITIIGIVGSLRHASLEEAPRPEMYLYYRQNAPVQPFVVIRASTDPASLAAAARQAVRNAGADAPFDVKTMLQVKDSAVSERRFVLWLVAIFGAIALTLSAVGVYGVVTLVADERGPEVGIRLALGAQPAQVLALLLRQATSLALVGVAIGAAIGLLVAPSLSSQFFGVTPFDPTTYLTVAITLLVIATLAAYVPARRAMRVDPVTTLR